ncbi:unnamed protein product [Sphacelaria rigidula]
MIHRNKRPAPSYHWEGFGRKNTKPPWFDVRIFDKERRDMGWVINNTDPPGGSTKVRREGAAPFVHDDDPRIYRPTVPGGKGRLSVDTPATPSSRALVSREGTRRRTNDFGGNNVGGAKFEEAGAKAKLAAMSEAFRGSRRQMLANLEISRRSELGETICGRGESIKKPLLYPQTVTHQQALTLEKKAGPRPLAEDDDTSAQREKPSFEPWNQHMYLPYSRRRSDFPHLQ